MKKKTYILLLLLAIIFLPKTVLAAPSISLSCRGGTVSVGSTISVTVSGSASEEVMWDITAYSSNESKLKISSDSRFISESFSNSVSKTYKFLATDTGSVSVQANATGSNYSGIKGSSSSSCTINVVAKTETKKKVESSKSSDNSLKSLEIDGATLTPEFNKDTLEYNVEIESDEKTKVNIKASSNDSKAKVEGTGEREVDLGLNKLEINVRAENDSVRTYIINLTVSEKNPIIVKVDGKKYKLMRKINGIDIPAGYEKVTIKIKGKEVEALKNSKTGYILVALVDSKNKTSLYIYKNNKYTKYDEFTNGQLKLLILKAKNKDIPYKYKKCTFNINDSEINGYELSYESRFKLVYALNLDTNEKDFYLYDLDQKTFQRFYNEQVEIYVGLVKKFKIGLVILAGVFAVLLITIICLSRTNSKTKKKINKITNKRVEKI